MNQLQEIFKNFGFTERDTLEININIKYHGTLGKNKKSSKKDSGCS